MEESTILIYLKAVIAASTCTATWKSEVSACNPKVADVNVSIDYEIIHALSTLKNNSQCKHDYICERF